MGMELNIAGDIQLDMSGLVHAEEWLSVQQAKDHLLNEGLPRNERTVRRYCMRGDLDCRKTENALHQPQYFINKASVETYIAQQKTLMAAGSGNAGHARTVPEDAGQLFESSVTQHRGDHSEHLSGQSRVVPDRAGYNRTAPAGEFVDQLQARLKDKDEEILFLRSELLHRRTTDSALHDVIAAFRANAEAQRIAAAPAPRDEGQGTTSYQSSM